MRQERQELVAARRLEDVDDTVELLQRMLDDVPVRVSYWDDESLNLFANKAFLDWFDVKRADIAGRHAREVIGKAWFARIEGPIADGLAGQASRFETSFRADNGARKHLDLRFTPDLKQGRVRGLIVHVADVTALRDAERELVRREARFRLLVDAVQDYAIYMLDAAGRVATWNAGAVRNKGYQAEEVIGKHFGIFFEAHDATSGQPERELAHAAREGRFESEGWRVRADGSRFWASVLLTAIHDEDKQVIGYAKITRDLSEHKRAAEQLATLEGERQRRLMSEAASKAKSDFLASMSHEIRTPMNAILGLSYLTLQCTLEEKPRNYVEKVHKAAENLLGILNDILDISKVEAGEMQLERIQFGLAEVLDNVMDTAGVKAQAKGLAFRLEIESTVPRLLVGDAMRLGQVLLNLADNAIKFTEHGQVLIQVESLLQLGNRVELMFSVGDTGAGIPTEKQRVIFKKFTQADASVARGHGGSGLGLAISRQLVELMGGTLGVQSQVGSGSTFHFNARFEAAADAGSQSAQVTPLPSHADAGNRDALRGAKILLVEDNEVNQLVACEMLRPAGIEVLVANNGREALDLLNAQPDVALVLMDCYMPVMDGFAATRAIRASKHFRHLPVLAMTANVLPDDLLNCRVAGMNDHIGKPFRADDLFAALSYWLIRRGRDER
ncbi:MAG: ATP-binding protein [Pseudomonadota bacterium]